MGIATRIMRICRADIHGVMDSLEDRRLLLRQYLREMDEALSQMESEIRQASAARRRLNEQLARTADAAARLERDLTVAVEREKDDIARMLIRKLRPLRAHHGELQRRIESAGRDLAQRRDQFERRRLRYDQIKLKASLLERPPSGELWETGPAENAVSRPTEEEVELELMQRKEALASGGAG